MAKQARLVTLPPNASLDRVVQTIRRDSGVIIRRAFDAKVFKEVRQEVCELLDDTPVGNGEFFGFHTIRAGGLLAKCPATHKLALHPLVLGAMDHFLLPGCSRYQINLAQAIRILPGERGQIPHRDDEMFPVQKPFEFMANAMWAIDDFTFENGATRIVPGSHKGEGMRHPPERDIAAAEMPAGSVLIYLGSAVHGGGPNTSKNHRTGLALGYCLGWLRQSENQYLANPPAIARHYPEKLQDLVGYAVHRPNLGWFDGQDPSIALQEDRPEHLPTTDFLLPDSEARIKAYYSSAA